MIFTARLFPMGGGGEEHSNPQSFFYKTLKRVEHKRHDFEAFDRHICSTMRRTENVKAYT